MTTSLRLVNFENFTDETTRLGPFAVTRARQRQRQEQHPLRLPLLHGSGRSQHGLSQATSPRPAVRKPGKSMTS